MGCEGSKNTGVPQPTPHHVDGKTHFGGWKPKSKKYQRAIGHPESAPLMTDSEAAPMTIMAEVPHLSGIRDGRGELIMATVAEAKCEVEEAVACQSRARDGDNVPDGVSDAPIPKVVASHEASVLDDESNPQVAKVGSDTEVFLADRVVTAHAGARDRPSREVGGPMSEGIFVDEASDKVSMLPAIVKVSVQAQKPLSSDLLGRCPVAMQQLWPFMCPGNAALIAEDAFLFGAQVTKDDKFSAQDHSVRQFPVFTCMTHCRRSCSAGSEAEISAECGTQIAAH